MATPAARATISAGDGVQQPAPPAPSRSAAYRFAAFLKRTVLGTVPEGSGSTPNTVTGFSVSFGKQSSAEKAKIAALVSGNGGVGCLF